MEILQVGERIILRLEEYDTVRTVHMGDDAPVPAPGPLGHSTGHWDGTTLVVQTEQINWGHFDQAGIPMSAAVSTTEYFSPGDDGGRLDYRIVVTDPATFTKPVELTKFWLNVPGVSVQAYACTAGQE